MLDMGMLTSPKYVLFSCCETMGKSYCLGTVGESFRKFQKFVLVKNEINQDVPLQSHKRDVLDLYLDSKM